MQSPVDGRDRSRSRARDRRTIGDRAHIDENVANNGQPTDNTRVIINDANRTPLQVQMARNGQSRPGKRPIKNVSPADKVGAIDRVHDGESKASVARDIGVPESTLRGWCKSEHKIRSQCNNATTEMIPQHSPVNMGNGRSISTNSRQSVGSRHSSNSRQSPTTPPDEDVPVAKRAKIERTARQNSPQNVMTGPSTSALPNYLSHNQQLSLQNWTAFLAMFPDAQNNIYSMLPSLKDMISRNNPVGLVENGLQYTRTNNTTFSTIANTSMTNTPVNITGIEGVRSTVSNIIGNAMGNALDHTIGNRNIAVAPTQGASNSYTRKSPSVTPAAEAPMTPAPASPHAHENNAHPRETVTNIDTDALSKEALMTCVKQDIMAAQRISGHNFENINNFFVPGKGGWFWPWIKFAKQPIKDQCTRKDSLAYLNMVYGDNSGNMGSDDNSESRARSHSVSSGRSDGSREERDSSITAATAERGTLTTPPVIEPTFTPEILEALRVAKMNPSNAGIEQAIEYATWLQQWLNNCSIPLLTTKQVLQQKYMLEVLKWVKNTPQSTSQSEVASESCKTSGSHDEGTQL